MYFFLTAIHAACNEEIAVYSATGKDARPCDYSRNFWCFSSETPTLTLRFNEPQVVRQLKFVGNMKIRNSQNFYTTLSEFGRVWSLVNATSETTLDRDLATDELELFAIKPENTSATLKIVGCPKRSTAETIYTFSSTSRALEKHFGSIGNFATDFIRRLSHAAEIPVESLVFSDLTETGGEISVSLRVLPSSELTAAQIRLRVQPGASPAIDDFIRTTQFWIKDLDPFICAGKICEAADMCLAGLCVARNGSVSVAAERPAMAEFVAPVASKGESSRQQAGAKAKDLQTMIIVLVGVFAVVFGGYQSYQRGNEQ